MHMGNYFRIVGCGGVCEAGWGMARRQRIEKCVFVKCAFTNGDIDDIDHYQTGEKYLYSEKSGI